MPTENTSSTESDDISDDEFESLLDALGDDEPAKAPTPKNDDIRKASSMNY